MSKVESSRSFGYTVEKEIFALECIYNQDLTVYIDEKLNETHLWLKLNKCDHFNVLYYIAQCQNLMKIPHVFGKNVPKEISKMLDCKNVNTLEEMVHDLSLGENYENVRIYCKLKIDENYPITCPGACICFFVNTFPVLIETCIDQAENISQTMINDIYQTIVLEMIILWNDLSNNTGNLIKLYLKAEKSLGKTLKNLYNIYKKQIKDLLEGNNDFQNVGRYESGTLKEYEPSVDDDVDADGITQDTSDNENEILIRRTRIRNVSLSVFTNEDNENNEECSLAREDRLNCILKVKTFNCKSTPSGNFSESGNLVTNGPNSIKIPFGGLNSLTLGSVSEINNMNKSNLNEFQVISEWSLDNLIRPLPLEKSIEFDALMYMLKLVTASLQRLSKLNHSNWCSYRSIFILENYWSLTIGVTRQYVHGMSLFKLVQSFNVPVWTIRQWCIQLIDLTAYLHKEQILVYLSLNLQNIMVECENSKLVFIENDYVIERLNDISTIYKTEWKKCLSTGLVDLKKRAFGSQFKLFKYVKRFDCLSIALLLAVSSIGRKCESLITQDSSIFNKCKKQLEMYAMEYKKKDKTLTNATICKSELEEKMTCFFNSIFNIEENRAFNSIPKNLLEFLKYMCICVFSDAKVFCKIASHDFLKRDCFDDLDEVFSPIKQNLDKYSEKIPNLCGIEQNGATNTILNSYIPSRFKNDFVAIQHLGVGGFGSVIKVKNVLDGNFYAIKKIKLNSYDGNLTKRLTREVKLLSRLNHENVVRYYQSWIEMNIDGNSAFESDSESLTPEVSFQLSMDDDQCDKTLINDFNSNDNYKMLNLAANYVNLDISDSDSEDLFGSSRNIFDQSCLSSEFIQFKPLSSETIMRNNLGIELSELNQKPNKLVKHKPKKQDAKIFSLYIQMEFCEKQTLRHLIDDSNLALNKTRIWKLCRGILEGLGYIHQQQMIHRDLKPANIFLGSTDSVKIGDFGLATCTSAPIFRSNYFSTNSDVQLNDENALNSQINLIVPLTGNVGTAYYVSPEVLNGEYYDSKIDMYAMGIMLFEMSYRKMNTGMERCQVLTSLRNSTIKFPDDFSVDLKGQADIIRKLLNWDPKKRPSADQLLQEGVIPDAHSLSTFDMYVKIALTSLGSTTNRTLLRRLFTQEQIPIGQSANYLKHVRKGIKIDTKALLKRMETKFLIEDVFKTNGAVSMLNVPILSPHTSLYDRDSSSLLIEKSGLIVQLPYDLRFSFAMYLSTLDLNGLSLKRYTIDRVFRQRKMTTMHPKEYIEIAFDYLSFSNQLDVKYELIKVFHSVTNRIVNNRLLNLKNIKFVICINHRVLIETILLSIGVTRTNVLSFFKEISILSTHNTSVLKNAIRDKFKSLDVSDDKFQQFINCIYQKIDISAIDETKSGESENSQHDCLNYVNFETVNFFKKLFAQNSKLGSVFFDTLREVVDNIIFYQIYFQSFSFEISLNMLYNCHLYSKFFFQISCVDSSQDDSRVFASGGMYEQLLSQFVNAKINPLNSVFLGGISFDFEALVNMRYKFVSKFEMKYNKLADICLCLYSNQPEYILKAIKIKNIFIDNQYAVTTMECISRPMNDIQHYCSQYNIPYIVILKTTKNDLLKYTLRYTEKDKIVEKSMSSGELIEFMKTKGENIITNELNGKRTKGRKTNEEDLNTKIVASKQNVPISITFTQISSNRTSVCNIKKWKRMIVNQIEKYLPIFNKNIKLCVIAVDLDSEIFYYIFSKLNFFTTNSEFEENCKDIYSSLDTKHQTTVKSILNCIRENHFEEKYYPIVLYDINFGMRILF